jgi:hypothetical protein
LAKTGCISACRACGISRNTVRRHRGKWPDFEAKMEAALATAATELETIAWQRAVEGVPEVVIRDGKVAWIKIKPVRRDLEAAASGRQSEEIRANRKFGRPAKQAVAGRDERGIARGPGQAAPGVQGPGAGGTGAKAG